MGFLRTLLLCLGILLGSGIAISCIYLLVDRVRTRGERKLEKEHTRACELIDDEAVLGEMCGNTGSERIRRISCAKLGHQWELTGEEVSQCRERGGGQYLDPCYGVDCAFCEQGGYVRTYTCIICGAQKTENEH